MASLHGAPDFISTPLFEERLMKAICVSMTARYVAPWANIHADLMNEFPREYQGLTADMLPLIWNRMIATNRENNTTSTIVTSAAARIMGPGCVNQMTTGSGGMDLATIPAPTSSSRETMTTLLDEFVHQVSENEDAYMTASRKSTDIKNATAWFVAKSKMMLSARNQEERRFIGQAFAPLSMLAAPNQEERPAIDDGPRFAPRPTNASESRFPLRPSFAPRPTNRSVSGFALRPSFADPYPTNGPTVDRQHPQRD